jgi:hypothetical protein
VEPLVQVKPPLLLVNGQFMPGPKACQLMGSDAWRLELPTAFAGCDVGGLSQSVQSIQVAL